MVRLIFPKKKEGSFFSNISDTYKIVMYIYFTYVEFEYSFVSLDLVLNCLLLLVGARTNENFDSFLLVESDD